MRDALTVLAAVIIILPPVPASGRSTMVAVCGTPNLRFYLPIKPNLPTESDGHDCCKKGCHAASDRRKRLTDDSDDVGEDDRCC